MRAIDEYDGQATIRIGLQLLALLCPRPGNCDTRGEANSISTKLFGQYRPNAQKRGALNRIPLPNAIVLKLKELKALTGSDELTLPSLCSVNMPVSDVTFTAALRRMGFAKEEMTAHGFRATFSTLANESGLWNPDAIESALAHVEGNAVRAAYARSEFWDERVKMATWWASYLAEIRQSA